MLVKLPQTGRLKSCHLNKLQPVQLNNILFCLNHGTALGWFIDPQERSIIIFKPGEQPEIKQNQDSLSVLSSLGELRLSVQDVFSWLSLS